MSKASVIKGGLEGLTTFASLLTPVSQIQLSVEKPMSKSQRVESEAAERGFEAGFQKGLEEGAKLGELQAHQEAMAAYEQELAIFRAELEMVVHKVEQSLLTWTAQAEESVTDLVADIARQAICSELHLDRSSILEIVKNALSEVTHSKEATIKVNPFDSAILARHKQALLKTASSLKSIEIVEDPTILGGALIETSGGVVDATVEGKLESLQTQLEAA